MRETFGNAFGFAFLIGAMLTLPIAILETTLSESQVAPTAKDILYGIDVHWLLVLALCLLLKLFW